jgi:hypothetical protein
MKARYHFLTLTGMLSLAGFPLCSMSAADLSGSWEGRVTCNCFDGNKLKRTGGQSVITAYVSQYVLTDPNGPTQPVLCLRLGVPGFPPSHTGRVIESANKPGTGEVILVGLGINPTLTPPGGDGPYDLGRGTFATGQKDTMDATITKVGFNIDPGITAAACTCQWRFDRLDSVDPGLVCANE